jgi:hypothetical protein
MKGIAYRITELEINNVIRTCTICQSRRNMITKPLITPKIAMYPREKFLFDLIYLIYISTRNCNYNWILTGIDSFNKFSNNRNK